MKQYKTLAVVFFSIIALVGGIIGISLVFDLMTTQAAYDLGGKVLAVCGILVVVTVAIIEVLKFNKKD